MHSLTTPQIKRAAAGGRAAGYGELQRIPYHSAKGSSTKKSENLRLCTVQGCSELRFSRSCFCQRHYREYRAWEEPERQRKIKGLLAASTPAECEAIERGRRAGRKLRQEAEALI